MTGLDGVGRLRMIAGAALLLVGGLLMVVGRFTGAGRLPGDILIQRDNVTFYFPIVTMIVLSLVLTVVINVVLRVLNR